MKKTTLSMMLLGSLLAVGSQAAFAAPDWSKVPKRDIHVFHPGVSPMEWVGKKSDHSGTAGLKKGETCIGCHEEKGALNFDFKRLAGKDMEPKGAPKTMNYPVAVQAAYDASNLYIRLTFKAPAGGADQGDKENEVKATVMFPDAQVQLANQAGCWASCHWKSAKGAKVANGSVTTERKMDGGTLGAQAEGSKSGDTYTVTFTSKNPGEGKAVPFGIAIHGDHSTGRFHHVSLGYTLGVGADGDVKALKQ